MTPRLIMPLLLMLATVTVVLLMNVAAVQRRTTSDGGVDTGYAVGARRRQRSTGNQPHEACRSQPIRNVGLRCARLRAGYNYGSTAIRPRYDHSTT